MTRAMYKHILVPTDGSALSLKAAREAAKLARRVKARITALYVIAPFEPPRPISDEYVLGFGRLAESYATASAALAREALDKVRTVAARAKVKCDQVALTYHRPWDGIIRTARAKKFDLIVMASHGRSGLEGLLLGSETHKVLVHSKTPVLVCR